MSCSVALPSALHNNTLPGHRSGFSQFIFICPFVFFSTLEESKLSAEETSFKVIKTSLVSIFERCNFIHGISIQSIQSLRLWIAPLNKGKLVCLYYELILKTMSHFTDNNSIHLRQLSADRWSFKGFLHVNT